MGMSGGTFDWASKMKPNPQTLRPKSISRSEKLAFVLGSASYKIIPSHGEVSSKTKLSGDGPETCMPCLEPAKAIRDDFMAMFIAGDEWAQAMGTVGGAVEKELQEHIDGGHAVPLDPKLGIKCDACTKAFMRDKAAFQMTRSKHEEQLETMNGDLLDMGVQDCNGDRYNFNAVVVKTRLGKSGGMPRKESAGVMKLLARFKAWIEAKTDPGDKEKYRIQRFTHDPGSEFEGAVRKGLADLKVQNSLGEVDRHTDNSVVENRNGRLQNVATAMAVTAMGDNVEIYAPQAGCQLIMWANELINHTMISDLQKKEMITAHQEQYNTKETLHEAYGIQIHTWGELCYIYVKKKDRSGKLTPKAVRCVWNGTNLGNSRSVSGIPIVARDGEWVLQLSLIHI